MKTAGGAERLPNTMGTFQKLFARMGPVPRPESPVASFPPPGEDADKNGNDDDDMTVPTSPTDLPWPRTTPREEVTPLWTARDCESLEPLVRGGESHALRQLQHKVTSRPEFVATYEKPKTSPTSLKPSTTVLSPYLSLGCLSPRTMWHALEDSKVQAKKNKPSTTFSKPPVSLDGQLLWRDFNYLVAHAANVHEPGSWGRMEGNKHCRPIPWSDDPALLQAWQQGRTGYPWIDACMRQLQQQGWIHHLSRHAVACFLTRGDLWQSWEKGAAHFESTLLDADYALNGFNWLWLSCSGFFYQYYRCYSPVAFPKKYDPEGKFVREFVPELKHLPRAYIYEPWKAPIKVQKQAGVIIGRDYPHPIVDHAVESKENMGKLSLAYDCYKESQKTKGSSSDKSKKTKRGAVSSSSKTIKGSSSKKQKKITDSF